MSRIVRVGTDVRLGVDVAVWLVRHRLVARARRPRQHAASRIESAALEPVQRIVGEVLPERGAGHNLEPIDAALQVQPSVVRVSQVLHFFRRRRRHMSHRQDVLEGALLGGVSARRDERAPVHLLLGRLADAVDLLELPVGHARRAQIVLDSEKVAKVVVLATHPEILPERRRVGDRRDATMRIVVQCGRQRVVAGRELRGMDLAYARLAEALVRIALGNPGRIDDIGEPAEALQRIIIVPECLADFVRLHDHPTEHVVVVGLRQVLGIVDAHPLAEAVVADRRDATVRIGLLDNAAKSISLGGDRVVARQRDLVQSTEICILVNRFAPQGVLDPGRPAPRIIRSE